MIDIGFYEDEKQHRLGFSAEGHAMAGPKGADLVCAAASTLAGTLESYAALLLCAEGTPPEPPVIEAEDGRMRLLLSLSPEGYLLGRIAFHVVRTGFLRLAAAYPASIKLTVEG